MIYICRLSLTLGDVDLEVVEEGGRIGPKYALHLNTLRYKLHR